MISHSLGRTLLSAFLLIGLVFRTAPSAVVLSNRESAAVQPQPAPENPPDTPSVRGLEKLSPDLRALWEGSASVGDPSVPAPAASSAGLLAGPQFVSALVTPDTDAQQYFLRSARSRQIAGIQWITGEIGLKELGKLVSLPGVLGVISTDTFRTTEAPGLADLRWNAPGPGLRETRELLRRGEPERLSQRLQIAAGASAARQRSFAAQPVLSAAAVGGAPNLRTIHDVDAVHGRGIRGEGVIVGVVDTGVDFANPDLQGTQAVIRQGVYAGWPFSYDTISGVMYAIDSRQTVGPDNLWDYAGWTQYVHTLPVPDAECSAGICRAELALTPDGSSAEFQWPHTSKSGRYYYSVHPDLGLASMAYSRGINYPEGWFLPPPVIVADEALPGVYDTVYVDINYNHSLMDGAERATRDQPLTGADLNGDGFWDLSGGMLGWIADGAHHPPGVEVLYPDTSQYEVSEAGRLLAFISDMDGHGTSCASEIAGQGLMTDPGAIGPINPAFAGGSAVKGAGGPVVISMAPDAKIAAFQNGFNLPFDSWTLGILGMDGEADSGDEVNILSNSWGDSRLIEDGWDPVSRFAQRISLEMAPQISMLAATGNGGHGYGTVTSPAGGAVLSVGASTAYGALRSFEPVSPEQYLYGNVQPWSNRGPGGLGDIAPDVVAVGAWGTGAVPLNRSFGHGQAAYDVFGGTSMSTPVTAGVLALLYQAYSSQMGSWPDWKTARALLLNGAQDLGYDVFTQGAGSIRAGRSVEILSGAAPSIFPVEWQAGGYHDAVIEGFPNIVHPGETSQQIFTLRNPTGAPLTAIIKDTILEKTQEQTFSFTFTNPPPKTQRALPIFLKDLTPLIDGQDPDLVRVQVVFPYSSFDVDGDDYADSWWSLSLYDWMDRDGDGLLWKDANFNGRIDDGELDIDLGTGLYEYNRFTYSNPQGTVLEASLGRDALARRHDGIFMGLRCSFCGQSATLQVRVTLYQKVDWPWLTLSAPSVDLPTGSAVDVTALLQVPEDAQPGAYQGAIEVEIGGESKVVPVVAHVAGGATFRFGGQNALDSPYDSSHLFGGFDWGWRYEAGDWRFFYYDITADDAGAGKRMVVDTRWNSPQTDVDTWILGPSAVVPGNITHPGDPGSIQVTGREGLKMSGGSIDTHTVGGQFLWNTSTTAPRELVSARVDEGLGLIALHNVLNGGLQLAEGVSGSVFQVAAEPAELAFDAQAIAAALPVLSGSEMLTLISTGDLSEGVQVQAFGMSEPIDLVGQFVQQNSPSNICSAEWIYRKNSGGLEVSHGGLLEIITAADPDLDLDIYLFEDDGDEKWICGNEKPVASSMNSGGSERIKITFPDDGIYWLVAHGYSVPPERNSFDMKIRLLAGGDLSVENLPLGPVAAGQPFTVTVNYLGRYLSTSPVTLEGVLLIGTPSVPGLLDIPIRLRPQILIYPRPELIAQDSWVRELPRSFMVEVQNQGTQPENVTAEIQLPLGLNYEPGSAQGPGTPPVYDPLTRKITWTGELGDGQKAIIHFEASAEIGFPASKVKIPVQVWGAISGQRWLTNSTIWLNAYGVSVPFIRH